MGKRGNVMEKRVKRRGDRGFKSELFVIFAKCKTTISYENKSIITPQKSGNFEKWG